MFCSAPCASSQVLTNLARCSVVEPAVGPAVVVLDVGADHLPGLVEGLELVAPDAALFEVAKPGLDERLALGVAVAAAAMCHAEAGEHEPGRACCERRAVIGTERERPGPDRLLADGGLDNGDRLLGAAAQRQVPADDLAGAAIDDRVQVHPAVLSDPNRRHVQMPELPGPLDPEEPGPPALGLDDAALDQPPLAHHRSTRLRLTCRPSRRHTHAVTSR